MLKNIDNFIESLFSKLNSKQKKVLKERYGLVAKKRTLQEIGDDLSITRERVRQIEEQSLKKLKDDIKNSYGPLLNSSKDHLNTKGGIREDNTFLDEVITLAQGDPKIKNLKNKIRFFFFAVEEPLYSRENPELKSFWYSAPSAKTQLLSFLDKTIKTLEDSDKSKILEEKSFPNKIKNLPEYHFLFISKKFDVNPFGDVGLVKWPEIKPKNIKDKAYLVLKKTGLPLHFRDISKHIVKSGVSSTQVNIQTVHNELIKDDRFVLVGRGIYALRENGYEPGTVHKVIVSLLENNGPLNSEEVVQLVNQKRMLKENTILLNLQNRKHFSRLKNGKYTLREA